MGEQIPTACGGHDGQRMAARAAVQIQHAIGPLVMASGSAAHWPVQMDVVSTLNKCSLSSPTTAASWSHGLSSTCKAL